MKHAWNKWITITKKIMHVQANIFLTIFFVLIIVPVGFIIKNFSSNIFTRHGLKKKNHSYWLKREKFVQNLPFAQQQ